MCPPPSPPAGVTGSPCTQASDCSSYICSVPVCYGAPPGIYCPNDEGCLPGFYCDRGAFVCTASLNPGDSCDFDNECPVGYGCDTLCKLLFSVDEGIATSHSLMCKSNFEFQGVCDSLIVFVNDVQLSSPFNCKIGEFCTYKSFVTGTVYDIQPWAGSGILEKGGGYCSFYLEYSNDLVQDNYVYLTYTYSTCSGYYAHCDDPDVLLMCGSITQDQRDFLFNMRGQARYWSLFQSGMIQDCSVAFNLFNYTYLSIYYENAWRHAFSLMLMLYFFI